MRYSQLFGKTRKEVPRDATIASHQLLLRAGFIHQTAAGMYSYLPLGYRVLHKLDVIIKEELAKKGVQHLLMPFIHPASLWEETGRKEKFDVLASFESRHGGECVIAPTHEETVTDLARSYVQSYRDLPVILNQNQWKYRDEIRVSGGLLRTREFLMQDAYSFDRDAEGLDLSFRTVSQAYHAIFDRIGLDMLVVQADSGTIGGKDSEEFMLVADIGEDVILTCNTCDYKANFERALSRFETYPQDADMKSMEAVQGEGLVGVEPLAEFLGLEVHQTTKTLLFQADDRIVAAMIRGEYDINETKLKNYLDCNELALASPETVKRVTGADVGYAGPVGLPDDVEVVADLTCEGRINFEAGANETNYHNINVNFERDFPTPPFVDIRAAKAGDACAQCDGCLQECCGIELGHVFKLGTVYSEKMNATFVDDDGKEKLMIMGCYGIGISRIVSAVPEVSHDDRGIIWPDAIAPFQAHLVSLGTKDEAVVQKAEELYEQLVAAGIEVLYDDRPASPGEKLADADLIGIPHRIVIGKKSLEQGGVEWKRRDSAEAQIVKSDEVVVLLQ